MRSSHLAIVFAALILLLLAIGAPAAEPSFRALDFFPSDVSFDGSVAVGERSIPNFGSEPVRWTAAGGTVGLGYPRQEHRGGRAIAVSADGSTIVGQTWNNSSGASFYWTAEGGLVDLIDLGLRAGDTPTDVSGDGAIVVGYRQSAGHHRVTGVVVARVRPVDTAKVAGGARRRARRHRVRRGGADQQEGNGHT